MAQPWTLEKWRSQSLKAAPTFMFLSYNMISRIGASMAESRSKSEVKAEESDFARLYGTREPDHEV